VCVVISEELVAKSAAGRQADEHQRMERLAELRDEDRARLANHRLRREKVKISVYCNGQWRKMSM